MYHGQELITYHGHKLSYTTVTPLPTMVKHGRQWKAMVPWSIFYRGKYGENGIKIEVIMAWCWTNDSESLCRKTKKPTNARKTYLPDLSDPSLQNLPQASEPFDSSLDHRPRLNKVALILGLQGLAPPFPVFIVVLSTSLTAIYDISVLTPLTK